MDQGLLNVILVGSAFMILFSAFQSTGMVEQSVLEGVKNETTGNGTARFTATGYTSFAIIYSSFTVVNIVSPAIVSILGPSLSMFIGASTYFFYVLSFIQPMTWSFYLASVLIGVGAAILWTAFGVYLAVNSDELSTLRNSGVFWALFQLRKVQLPGNLYIYLVLKSDIINRHTRYLLFTVFSVVCGIGLLVFILLIWRSFVEKRLLLNSEKEKKKKKIIFQDIKQELLIALKLLKTPNMLLLLIPFAYSG
ncbi:unnamed protein product [Didymodactylos carnosus]|uniref:UNC93-like protein MFSD11 n=1 Tax=Didymodactylos carnosus TaxID=1234261 RepID=A0A814EFG2_9BILA|nr:unnamed protein product [Didymodactylos carnosus]CAF1156578.1 unnamed protein product [Didymodactylos carnosus]CAF3741506.1 unnamed protein product [Didymodactylos carnosus]CAF3968068.1 unnamed protein product [Didymodactylos carnosus]